MTTEWAHIVLVIVIPILFISTFLYVYSDKGTGPKDEKYQVHFRLRQGKFNIDNIKRGASVIGSAGSGKTESVIYNFLQHFSAHNFCGILHDYKNFELTEMAYPLFKDNDKVKFYTIAFDQIHYRVNPIAPRYLHNEESVNEISKVLMENLLEMNESNTNSTTKFFNDAVEGLMAGLIWKLKTTYPQFCTLPHLIAIFQTMDTRTMAAFLASDLTSKGMASAFINGMDSERQTAGVRSTLANALKKISSRQLFMVLSKDEVPLNINNDENPAVISLVNHPKYESAFSPIIAAVLHTVIKEMSVRHQKPSFLLMEEAPTLRLPNMHRIPATLRSYDIATVYVMQDKVQNEILYGDKISRAILSNLSYQFFGKVNDPDTAKYYERFFEIVRKETTSVNRGHNLNFDTRITTGEKEVAKRRADMFFRLQQGEFIAFADGKDTKVQFKLQHILRELPRNEREYSDEDLRLNFEKIHREARAINRMKKE
ncbi:type IV secretory system conjugative DNA transfer family protein [Arenibacter algicola]|uniref:Type IV secretion-system coupling protein DNA-binding domain protein n=1 Tax=Arenibacter algicola TaxID=616991 RepID=A0A221V1P9_9FLAO|nr:type IV secretion system DNA-binding domain-containing protein [Arenibacter algicola]ASO07443.1 type IV secretion-system coupling protein DNA-binding domain protein [Arenibacter algicola]|tara:strand:+ start:14307 stop:15758 length:1452 start_codon:yes stop_codon:yes gene_type:complete